MANFLSHAAAQARYSLGQSKIDVKYSWPLEILAACLGYETLAALTSEQTDGSLHYHVGDAEILVLNLRLAVSRAIKLCVEPHQVVSKCVEALEQCMTVPVFRNVIGTSSSAWIEEFNGNVGKGDGWCPRFYWTVGRGDCSLKLLQLMMFQTPPFTRNGSESI
ncbi:hypothetical protein D3C84_396520 [compost metagenome]